MSSYCDIMKIGDVNTMKDNRLFRILYYILEKGKVTASELADKASCRSSSSRPDRAPKGLPA